MYLLFFSLIQHKHVIQMYYTAEAYSLNIHQLKQSKHTPVEIKLSQL